MTSQTPFHRTFNTPGIFFTDLLAIFLAWSGWIWWGSMFGDAREQNHDIRKNEVLAWTRLQEIRAAQEAYHQQTPAPGIPRQYTLFFAHLWTSVDWDGRPVPMNLISKRLASALGPARSLDGYYYIDIHERTRPGSRRKIRIDYDREWAVAAAPALNGKTGNRVFLADESGKVYAKVFPTAPTEFPLEPEKSGWQVIESSAFHAAASK